MDLQLQLRQKNMSLKHVNRPEPRAGNLASPNTNNKPRLRRPLLNVSDEELGQLHEVVPRLDLRESVENEHASADNDDDNDDHDDDDTTNNNNDDMENPDPDVPIAPTPNSSNKEKGKKSSKPFLFSLLEAMASHRFGTIFESPVRKSDAPDYYSVIKKPMDLKTIKGKIKDGRIERIDELERDVLLMFSNAMMYNAPDSQVYEMAKEMMKDCEGHFAHFRNMEMELENEG